METRFVRIARSDGMWRVDFVGYLQYKTTTDRQAKYYLFEQAADAAQNWIMNAKLPYTTKVNVYA